MKRLSFVVLILVAAYYSQAQLIGVGFQAGPSLSFASGTNFAGTDLIGSEINTGFFGGLSVQARPRRFFSVLANVNYIQKGVQLNSRQNRLPSRASLNALKTSYLEIPLLIRLNFNQYTSIRPNVSFGPSLAWMLTAKDNFLLPNSDGTPEREFRDTETNYQSFDPGVSVGIGIDIDASDWSIFTMGVRYTHGLGEVVESGTPFTKDVFALQNRNVVLSFGMVFLVPTYTMNTGKKKENFEKYKKYMY